MLMYIVAVGNKSNLCNKQKYSSMCLVGAKITSPSKQTVSCYLAVNQKRLELLTTVFSNLAANDVMTMYRYNTLCAVTLSKPAHGPMCW